MEEKNNELLDEPKKLRFKHSKTEFMIGYQSGSQRMSRSKAEIKEDEMRPTKDIEKEDQKHQSLLMIDPSDEDVQIETEKRRSCPSLHEQKTTPKKPNKEKVTIEHESSDNLNMEGASPTKHLHQSKYSELNISI